MELGYFFCCVVIVVGIIGIVVVDFIFEISVICVWYNVWYYIDVAYVGFVFILLEY